MFGLNLQSMLHSCLGWSRVLQSTNNCIVSEGALQEHRTQSCVKHFYNRQPYSICNKSCKTSRKGNAINIATHNALGSCNLRMSWRWAAGRALRTCQTCRMHQVSGPYSAEASRSRQQHRRALLAVAAPHGKQKAMQALQQDGRNLQLTKKE